MDKDLDKKLQDWMDKQDASTLVCFQCKQEPEFIYFPEDLSWGPILICKKCRNHFDAKTKFAVGEIEGKYH